MKRSAIEIDPVSRPVTLIATAALLTATSLPSAGLANPVSCQFGDLSRSIEVVYSDPGQPVPCEVIYDKSAEGSMASLWRANVEAGYCEARAAELVAKLEGMGWRCDTAASLELPSGDAAPEADAATVETTSQTDAEPN